MQGGDTIYWKNLPCDILKAVVEDKLEVWPIFVSDSDQSAPLFSKLQSLLVASESDDHETLVSLAAAGVSMTRPPGYVKALLSKADLAFTALNPESAHRALRVRHLSWTVLAINLLAYI